MQSSAKEPLTRRSTDLPSDHFGHTLFPVVFFPRLTFLKKSKSCQENRYCMYIQYVCMYIYIYIERERERISGTPDFKKVKVVKQRDTFRFRFTILRCVFLETWGFESLLRSLHIPHSLPFAGQRVASFFSTLIGSNPRGGATRETALKVILLTKENLASRSGGKSIYDIYVLYKHFSSFPFTKKTNQFPSKLTLTTPWSKPYNRAKDEITCLGKMPSLFVGGPYRLSGFWMFRASTSKQKHATYSDLLNDRELKDSKPRCASSFWQQMQIIKKYSNAPSFILVTLTIGT